MANHLPRQRTSLELEWLGTLIIDPVKGLVSNCAGNPLGSFNNLGYIQIVTTFKGTPITVKRCHIIWWKATGKWPTKMIDHIDRNKINDQISNLREVTIQENNTNRESSVTRELPKGVYWIERTKKYQVQLCISPGKKRSLGYYTDIEDAVAAYASGCNTYLHPKS